MSIQRTSYRLPIIQFKSFSQVACLTHFKQGVHYHVMSESVLMVSGSSWVFGCCVCVFKSGSSAAQASVDHMGCFSSYLASPPQQKWCHVGSVGLAWPLQGGEERCGSACVVAQMVCLCCFGSLTSPVILQCCLLPM